ncbi:uncharacterized protein LOC112567431 [Pomacea canaliculata]|uniref:uncharacterized protein LOC112567431 n=1 Tax=Pomacea canaliculata TaxID=400727 RepID=UPI000D72C246|nr:uncharacterized protein LOC112567431 [Pomacea canaliculata]
MATFSLKFYFLLMIIMPQKITFAFTCGITTFNESLFEREGSLTNITYLYKVTDSSVFSDKTTFAFHLCRNNLLTTQCTFKWREKLDQMAVKNWSPGDGTFCSCERHISSSPQSWEIKISQLVSRSLSVMQLSLENNVNNKKTTQLIRTIFLNALYPPKVTSLTVDGHEVNGTHFTNEGQEVLISCSFDAGNPPVNFRLVDKNKELAAGAGRLNYPLSIQCEDNWPRVNCEGRGSAENRTVSFLLKCPPQFLDVAIKNVSLPVVAATFRVKSHTTAVEGCFLTSMSLEEKTTRAVKCVLNGHPPDLVLSLYLDTETSIAQGKWKLILLNEKGFANTTLSIIKRSGKTTFIVKITIIKRKLNYHKITDLVS